MGERPSAAPTFAEPLTDPPPFFPPFLVIFGPKAPGGNRFRSALRALVWRSKTITDRFGFLLPIFVIGLIVSRSRRNVHAHNTMNLLFMTAILTYQYFFSNFCHVLSPGAEY